MTVHGISFVWPAVLAGLVAVPVLLAAYLAGDGRRRRRVTRFANPALLPNVLPRRLGLRRHLPPVLLLLAFAALVVGAARPQRTVTSAVHQATLVLAIDTSRSMAATDVKPSRLAAARDAARTLVRALPEDGRVGVVAFTRRALPLNAPTDDRRVIEGSLGSLRVGGGTAVGDAIVAALQLLRADRARSAQANGSRPPAAIVLLSDGASTEGKVAPMAAAARAKQARVPVYTVALGTSTGTVHDPTTGRTIPVAPDPRALAGIARATGGRTYTAADAGQLRHVYDTIGRSVGTKRRAEDLAMLFVAAAAGLVLLAAAASMRLTGRLA